MLKSLTVALVMLTATPALAVDFAVNAGAIEVVSLPDPSHLGVYPYVGVSAVFDAEKVLIVPGVSVEWSPEFARWGVVGTLVIDYPISDWFGIDTILTLLHDQPGDKWEEALFFFGAGVGVSFVIDIITVSPSTSIFYELGSSGNFSFVPGLNISLAL